MGRPGIWQILLILVLILLIFGSAKLPDIARSIGQSMKVFKKEVKDLQDDPDADPEASESTEGDSKDSQ